jgi:hypothetical protein
LKLSGLKFYVCTSSVTWFHSVISVLIFTYFSMLDTHASLPVASALLYIIGGRIRSWTLSYAHTRCSLRWEYQYYSRTHQVSSRNWPRDWVCVLIHILSTWDLMIYIKNLLHSTRWQGWDFANVLFVIMKDSSRSWTWRWISHSRDDQARTTPVTPWWIYLRAHPITLSGCQHRFLSCPSHLFRDFIEISKIKGTKALRRFFVSVSTTIDASILAFYVSMQSMLLRWFRLEPFVRGRTYNPTESSCNTGV